MLYSIRIKFKSLLCGYPTSPTHLYSLKRLSLLREIALTPLWKLFGLLCEGLFLGFSPYHWSISLSVGQCAITVITIALQLALKSEHVISPALFFFKIVFCILCPVCKNFRIVFFPLFFLVVEFYWKCYKMRFCQKDQSPCCQESPQNLRSCFHFLLGWGCGCGGAGPPAPALQMRLLVWTLAKAFANKPARHVGYWHQLIWCRHWSYLLWWSPHLQAGQRRVEVGELSPRGMGCRTWW